MRSSSNRFVALVAAITVLLAATAFLAHVQHTTGTLNDNAHCDFCLQFGGAAGPSAVPALVTESHLVESGVRVRRIHRVASRRQYRAHRSRAPPLLQAL
jgi:hypothetical protein